MSDDGVVEGLVVGYAVGRFLRFIATIAVFVIADGAIIVALVALAAWYLVKVIARKRSLKAGLLRVGRMAIVAGISFVLPTVGYIALFFAGSWLMTAQWTQSHLWWGFGGAGVAFLGGFVLLVLSFYGAHAAVRLAWEIARENGKPNKDETTQPEPMALHHA